MGRYEDIHFTYEFNWFQYSIRFSFYNLDLKSMSRLRCDLPGVQQAEAHSVLAHAHKAAGAIYGVQHPMPPLRTCKRAPCTII